MKSVLFVMDEGIGNCVLALPAINAIREAGYDVSVMGKYPSLELIPEGIRAYTLDEIADKVFDFILLSAFSNSYISRYGINPPTGKSVMYQSDAIDGVTHESLVHFSLAACLENVNSPERLQDLKLPDIPTQEMDLPDNYIVFANTAAPGWDHKR